MDRDKINEYKQELFQSNNLLVDIEKHHEIIHRALNDGMNLIDELQREIESLKEERDQLHIRALNAEAEVNQLRAELAERDWIPVTERLPVGNHDVMVTTGRGLVVFGAYLEDYKKWWTGGGELKGVIAWRQLPDPYIPPEVKK